MLKSQPIPNQALPNFSFRKLRFCAGIGIRVYSPSFAVGFPHVNMKAITIALFFVATLVGRTVLGEPSPDAQDSMLRFLKQEAVRLDTKFLEGITNRQQWEALRPKLR